MFTYQLFEYTTFSFERAATKQRINSADVGSSSWACCLLWRHRRPQARQCVGRYHITRLFNSKDRFLWPSGLCQHFSFFPIFGGITISPTVRYGLRGLPM